MVDDNMIPSDAWDELDAWDKSQEAERRAARNLADRIASGMVEEPGAGDYDAYPQTEDDQAFNNFMMKSASEDDCNWVTMRGTPVCIGDDENIEIGPDGIDAPIKDDISQDDDIFHNIKTDPTKEDRAEIVQYFKDVATFKLRDDSLLLRVVKELTTDPTKEDRTKLFQLAGDTLTLKPIREFKLKPNPANSDMAEIGGHIKRVIKGTVGRLFSFVAHTVATDPKLDPLAAERSNKIRPHFIARSFVKSVEESENNDLVQQLTDEVFRRANDVNDVKAVQNAILDVFEELLAGTFKKNA